LESEIKLFQELNIDWLLVKNSGGSQSEAKLIAARELGIRVAMINRPNILKSHNYSDTTEVIKRLYGLSNE
jgi:precorrin-6A/cobalt-precorrin-6A reductase